MGLQDYLDKLRAKPVHERQRIAVVATGIAFSVIFLIWVVSFSEMNKSAETQAEPPASADDLSAGKASIEEMLQELPAADGTDTAPGTDNSAVDNSRADINSSDANTSDNVGNSSTENQSQDANSVPDNQREIPNLP